MKLAIILITSALLLVAAGCTKVGAPEVAPDYQSYTQPTSSK